MTKHTNTRYAAIIAALAMGLAACTPSVPAETPPGQGLESPPAADSPGTDSSGDGTNPDGSVNVPSQLRFTTTTVVDGTEFDASILAGQDTILWFWAPWCPTCQAESGGVAEAALELPEGVTLIGVAGRAEVADMQRFVSDFGVGGFEHLVDLDGSIWAAFDVPYQPAYAFINDDGEIVTVVGALGKSGLLAAAEDLASR